MLLLRSWTSSIPLTRLLSALLFVTSCPSIATAADRLRPILPKQADSLPQIQPDQSRAVQDLPSIGPLMDEVDSACVNLPVVLWVPPETKGASRVTRHAYLTVGNVAIKGDVKGMSEENAASLENRPIESAGSPGSGRKEIGNACFRPYKLGDLSEYLRKIRKDARRALKKQKPQLKKGQLESVDFLRAYLVELRTSGLLKQPLSADFEQNFEAAMKGYQTDLDKRRKDNRKPKTNTGSGAEAEGSGLYNA
ncbi:hypothetical protein FB446DRAFT_87705 [Lentinula raphanica]|nr:hypothetical protein FB446DRAFT_87705 [Lentinula raphanica]